MRFEHLVEVNNFDDPRIDNLTREQLWQGLLLRARAPHLFIEHMETSRLVEDTEEALSRELNFGKFVVRDRVQIHPMEKMTFHVPAQGEIPESSLVISIDEPFPERLFVRFVYEDGVPDEGPEAMYNDFKRSAYQEMDVDSIRLIHQFASQGRFDNVKH